MNKGRSLVERGLIMKEKKHVTYILMLLLLLITCVHVNPMKVHATSNIKLNSFYQYSAGYHDYKKYTFTLKRKTTITIQGTYDNVRHLILTKGNDSWISYSGKPEWNKKNGSFSYKKTLKKGTYILAIETNTLGGYCDFNVWDQQHIWAILQKIKGNCIYYYKMDVTTEHESYDFFAKPKLFKCKISPKCKFYYSPRLHYQKRISQKVFKKKYTGSHKIKYRGMDYRDGWPVTLTKKDGKIINMSANYGD